MNFLGDALEAFGFDTSNITMINSSAASSASATPPFENAAEILMGLFIAVSAYNHFSKSLRRGNPNFKAPLPPSPPGDFLLGHFRHVPEDESFRKYAEWSKEYSKLN